MRLGNSGILVYRATFVTMPWWAETHVSNVTIQYACITYRESCSVLCEQGHLDSPQFRGGLHHLLSL